MSLTEILFGTPDVQKALESRDARDKRGDAQDVPMDEDRASDKDGDEYAAAGSEDEQVETVPQSPTKNQTLRKSQKVITPDALLCSSSDYADEVRRTTRLLPRPQPKSIS